MAFTKGSRAFTTYKSSTSASYQVVGSLCERLVCVPTNTVT